MGDNVKFSKTIILMGGSKLVSLPPELCEYLEIDIGDEILLMADKGKHGSFVSFWKKTKDK